MAPKIEKEDEQEKNGSKSDKNSKDDKLDKDEKKEKSNQSDSNDVIDATAPIIRPPRKLSRPKITLKIPPMSPSIPQFFNTPGGMVTIPLTPASGLPPNCQIDVFQAYPNKAQEFMFKQFEDFKDFTKNTGKLGLSFGEKFAFWCYGKARGLSTNSFTHIFLLVIVALYCVLGGIAFFFIENEARENHVKEIQSNDTAKITNVTGEIFNYVIFHKQLLLEHTATELRPNMTAEMEVIIKELDRHYHEQYRLNQTKTGWGLLNSMYYCGTIFTTIGRIEIVKKQ